MLLLQYLDSVTPNKNDKHKVICVGDSLTEGKGASSSRFTYPTILSFMLNDEKKYDVANFGKFGMRASKTGTLSYWNHPAYQEALDSQPDTVLLMFGTFDKFTDEQGKT